MSAREKILDDMARMAGGAIGSLSNIRSQINEELRLRVDEMALKMDLVPRAEFERLELMLQESRLMQDALLKRLEDLENANTNKKAKS